MKSLTERYWKIPEKFKASSQENSLAGRLQVEPEIIRILKNRGYTEETSLQKFLYPTLHDLEDPFSIKGIEAASALISEGLIKNDINILIWGDYDVDGVTATSLLLRFFTAINFSPDWFIPNRFRDGYGLSKEILVKYVKKYRNKNNILITVDCGISNFDEIEYLKSNGWKIIITDHHEPDEIPECADAVVNVKQQGCNFENGDLSGVGTAFYLCAALRAVLSKKKYFNSNLLAPNLKNLLDLVAIGTIADMVPQSPGNRVLIKAGFEVINSNPSVGVKALLTESDIHDGCITSEDIAFQIAPKINAAGRLEEASLAVNLLKETNPAIAQTLAKKLTRLNKKRKQICLETLESTLTIHPLSMYSGDNIVVLKIECSLGVIGIVASQLVNKLKIPVILVTELEDKKHGKVLKGSCRSVSGINMYKLLSDTSEYHLEFGGHKMAAGVTLLEKNISKFREEASLIIERDYDCKYEHEEIDLELPIEKALSKSFIKQIQLLEPFGVKNNKPIFIEKKIIPHEIKNIGKNGDHLSFTKNGKYEDNKCIAFGFGEYENHLRNVEKIDAIYSISISRFKNAVRWQAQMVDFLP